MKIQFHLIHLRTLNFKSSSFCIQQDCNESRSLHCSPEKWFLLRSCQGFLSPMSATPSFSPPLNKETTERMVETGMSMNLNGCRNLLFNRAPKPSLPFFLFLCAWCRNLINNVTEQLLAGHISRKALFWSRSVSSVPPLTHRSFNILHPILHPSHSGHTTSCS